MRGLTTPAARSDRDPDRGDWDCGASSSRTRTASSRLTVVPESIAYAIFSVVAGVRWLREPH